MYVEVQPVTTTDSEVCLIVYLYGVGLVTLDSFSAVQCPGEGELWCGWVFLSFLWSISPPSWALLSSHTFSSLNLDFSLRIPLRVLSGFLFLLLLVFLLWVRVSFPLPVLSQLQGTDAVLKGKIKLIYGSWKAETTLVNNKYPLKLFSNTSLPWIYRAS